MPSDPHPRGGDLSEMAATGTKVPKDAAKPNVVSSKAGDDKPEGLGSGIGDNRLGSTSLGEVTSAAGGELPEDIGQKHSRSGGKDREHHHHTPHGGRNLPSH
ncbi:hypothetical protein QBC40DRAFT_232607 [Triangularia verruculosa]|uniref:Uncharacterized protein n=1 Tax=Triangularia verruculosa TaxID=2587418 RepID=A0AAN7AS15_9PEZI|nr:hypothetical protein QBC40DRAFT_232607 [Triangularia verruculosa]